MIFRNSKDAFDNALKVGKLNTDPSSPHYAANWMYMGSTETGADRFKNRDTRKYMFVHVEEK